jgi:hypothetical protein
MMLDETGISDATPKSRAVTGGWGLDQVDQVPNMEVRYG